MPSSVESIEQSRPYAQLVVVSFCAILTVAALIFLGYQGSWTQVAMIGVFPIAAIAMFVGAVGLLKRGPAHAARGWLVAGSIFVFGGVILDVMATLIYTPDLTQESNMFARILIDNGYSVSFLYAYGGFLQLCGAINMVVLWAAFLRHRETLVSASFAQCSGGLFSFFKAVLGGGHLTWRQWLFPFSAKELSSAYNIALALVPVLILEHSYRWWLGLEWFGIAPNARTSLLIPVHIVVATVCYVAWLYFEFRACHLGD